MAGVAKQCCSTRNCARRVPVFRSARGHPKRTYLRSTEQQSLFSDATLDEVTRQVLRSDPAVAGQLQRFEEAAMRVAKAQAALEEVNEMIAQASASEASSSVEVQQTASEVMAAAEIKAAEKRMEAAELELAIAQAKQAEYQQSLQREADRSESGKAGAVAAVGGALSSVPLLFASSSADPISGLLSLAANVASCVLFGVTYRYSVREDVTDTQLRLGVTAAFGLVRGAAAADALQQVAVGQGQSPFTLDVIGPAALSAGENMLLFAAAATALEVAFRNGWVKPRQS